MKKVNRPVYMCEGVGCELYFIWKAEALAHEHECDNIPDNKTCYTCAHHYYEKRVKCRKGCIGPGFTGRIRRDCNFWENFDNLHYEV